MRAPPGAAEVDRAALEDLLAAVPASIEAPLWPEPASLVDLQVAAEQARRFKVDASFALDRSGAAHARFSVNDKGEPDAFRERLRRADLGLPADLDDYLAIAPPGEVQTTLGVKWSAAGGPPQRTTVYFEELQDCPRAAEIIDAVFRWGLHRPAPPAPPLLPVSVCLDFSGGRVVAARDYHLVLESSDQAAVPLPAAQEEFRRGFALDPVRRTRRYLLARRFGPGGDPTGSKLLWVSEAHTPAAVAWAWSQVDRLRAAWNLPETATSRAMGALRAGWRHGTAATLYPDLVSMDADATMTPRALLTYVSVK